MAALHHKHIMLQPLTVADAPAFYNLYATERPDETEGKSPADFTTHVISLCEIIWTIRPAAAPHQIIGDCALHHWDKNNGTLQIGGSLHTAYRGKGYMAAAFKLAIAYAHDVLKARSISGHTKTNNYAAIKLVQKLSFTITYTDEEDTVLTLILP